MYKKLKIIVKKHIFEFFCILGFSIFALGVNPFGFQEATSGVSRDVLVDSYSASYPIISATEGNEISVVLFDELSLGPEGWPPKYSLYANTLRKILTYSPKAVMFDISLIDSRIDQSLDQLIEVILEYDRIDIPIFFPMPGKSTGVLSPVRPELIPLVETGKLVPVSVKLGKLIGNVPGYPVFSDESGNLSSAVKIVKELHPEFREKMENLETKGGEMEILWRNPSDTYLCSVEETYRCDLLTDNIFVRFIYLFFEGLFANIMDLTESISYQDFRPFNTIYVNEINEQDREILDPQLSKSVVFLGTELALVRDYGESIAYGSLPNVYFHAMAYHNLLVWKDNVLIRKNPLNFSDFEHRLFVTTLILIVLFLVRIMLFLHNYDKWIIKQPVEYLSLVNYPSLIVITFSIVFVEHYFFRISPVNWFGIIGTIVIIPIFYNWLFRKNNGT